MNIVTIAPPECLAAPWVGVSINRPNGPLENGRDNDRLGFVALGGTIHQRFLSFVIDGITPGKSNADTGTFAHPEPGVRR
jgi:hypothetical protein